MITEVNYQKESSSKGNTITFDWSDIKADESQQFDAKPRRCVGQSLI